MLCHSRALNESVSDILVTFITSAAGATKTVANINHRRSGGDELKRGVYVIGGAD